MFDKNYEHRLSLWRDFRTSLEHTSDPIQATIDFYSKAPMCKIQTEPYTPSTWPDPWELLEENIYCPFVKILAICYTLQLTDVLSGADFEIHITYDREMSQPFYLLYVNNQVIGYQHDKAITTDELPKTLQSVHRYPMQPQQ